MTLLKDRRVDPITRAYLLGMTGKKPVEWTLQDFATVTAVLIWLAVRDPFVTSLPMARQTPNEVEGA